ncbi:MAG: hypothetical protein E7212_03005 [Clostridium sartagoforme]|nr:hypothetical protein [Clostridium sartagoforme]
MDIKKVKTFDWVYISALLVIVIAGVFMPKTGKLAMVDVAIDGIILWGIFIYLILKIKKNKGGLKKNIYLYLVSLVLGFFSLLNTKNFVFDLVLGPQEIKLYDISIENRQSFRGIIGLHYYIRGTDENGDRHIIEISGSDYNFMRGNTVDTMVLTYYENTDRLYELGGQNGE